MSSFPFEARLIARIATTTICNANEKTLSYVHPVPLQLAPTRLAGRSEPTFSTLVDQVSVMQMSNVQATATALAPLAEGCCIWCEPGVTLTRLQ